MFACMVAISTGMFTLYMYSPLTAEVYRGGFIRNMAIKLTEKDKVDLRKNSYYIAGIDKHQIYLGNYTRPLLMTIFDRSSKKLTKIQIEAPELDSIKEPGYFRIVVTPTYFYMTHGVMPAILRGETGTWKAKLLKIDKNDYFDQITPMSSTSFALRFYSSLIDGYAIGKKQTHDRPSFSFDTTLLQQQIDRVFSVDGTLHYSRQLNKLVYLYAYRNEYVVSDSNLNLEYRANTIDTFKRANLQIASVTNSRKMLASRPSVVNKNSCVSGNMLYIESNILSKNEQKEEFMKSPVIDVYRLDDHAYLYSFYIPNQHMMADFKIHENDIATITNKTLTIFELTPPSEASKLYR